MSTKQTTGVEPAITAGTAKRKRVSVIICTSWPGKFACYFCIILTRSLAFISDLQRRLTLACSSGDSNDAETLAGEIDEHIHSLRNSRLASGGHDNHSLEKAATDLWNHCTRLRHEGGCEKPQRIRILILHGRLLAFLALELARWSETESTWATAAHLLRIALKTSKSCLGKLCSQTCQCLSAFPGLA